MLAECRGLSLSPLHRPEIKHDIAKQQGRTRPAIGPDAHLIPPLPRCFPPQRIARHDRTRTQRKARPIQALVEILREGAEPGIYRGVVLIRVILKHQAIILIRRQQAFTPPQAAHDQQGEGHRRGAVIHQCFRQNPPMQIQIDAIDQPHHGFRAQPFREQRAGNAGLGGFDGGDIAG